MIAGFLQYGNKFFHADSVRAIRVIDPDELSPEGMIIIGIDGISDRSIELKYKNKLFKDLNIEGE